MLLAHELGHDLWSAALIDLAATVNRSGLSVILQTPGGPQSAEAERRGLQVVRQPLPANLWQRWRCARRMHDMIAEEKIGAVFGLTGQWLPTLLGLGKHHPPMALHCANPATEPAVRQQMENFVARDGHFVVPSDYMRRYCGKELGAAPNKIALVPPGMQAQLFDPAQMKPERAMELADLWRVPEQSTLILHIGPLAPGHGMETMLAALAQMQRRDFYVVMLGAREIAENEAAQLQKLVDHYNLHGKVFAPAPCNDWPAAFWMAHAAVAAGSMPLGQNPGLIAAQLMGRPLIVADNGANREFVVPGKTARLFPAGDSGMLAAHLQDVMGLPDDAYARIAAAGQNFARDAFPWQAWMDGMTAACRDLCKTALSRDMEAA